MDLWLSVNGERVSTYSPLDPLARSVVISLFTWRRAMPDDNSDIPMGWWGDSWPVVQNDRYGSRLWLLQRRKLTNSLVNIVSTYIRESLQWMLDDGIATRIDIDVQRTGINALGNSITIWRRSG
ncbi:phage GP46 family protein, partial [Edwardsiella anguillarum]